MGLGAFTTGLARPHPKLLPFWVLESSEDKTRYVYIAIPESYDLDTIIESVGNFGTSDLTELFFKISESVFPTWHATPTEVHRIFASLYPTWSAKTVFFTSKSRITWQLSLVIFRERQSRQSGNRTSLKTMRKVFCFVNNFDDANATQSSNDGVAGIPQEKRSIGLLCERTTGELYCYTGSNLDEEITGFSPSPALDGGWDDMDESTRNGFKSVLTEKRDTPFKPTSLRVPRPSPKTHP